MSSRKPAIRFVAWLTAACAVPSWADEPRPGGAAPAVSAADIEKWIEQLGSPQFVQREAATRSLAEAGRQALVPLRGAIEQGDLEVASRAVEIVRAMLARDDGELAAEAERLLEQVSETDRHAVSRLADSTLDFHLRSLADAARERLEESGAVFRERMVGADRRGTAVEFDAAWRGGIDEWRQLTRLRDVVCVSVHGVPLDDEAVGVLGRMRSVRRIDLFGTGAGEAAVAALMARLPDALVDVRKGGKLGVTSLVQAGPCEISSVQPHSAADKAGLRAGDVIVRADGEDVASFEALTARLAQHGAGDAVRLEVARSGDGDNAERFECTVRLDAW